MRIQRGALLVRTNYLYLTAIRATTRSNSSSTIRRIILLLSVTYSITEPDTSLNPTKSAKTTCSPINATCLNSKAPYLLIIKVDFSLLFRPINYASLKAIALLLLHLLLSSTLLLNAPTEFCFALKHN
jgi:hypothetical protein